MKKPIGAVAVVVFSLALAGTAGAAPIYVWGAGPANWSDADKTNVTTTGAPDGLMCWAAAASNALAWAGWPGYDTGGNLISSADAIFSFFKATWVNDTGNVSFAYDWWFDNNKTDPTNPPVADAGFYTAANLTAPGGGPGYVYGGYYGSNPPTETALSNYISGQDRSVTIGIAIPAFGGYNHSITVWGIDSDTNQLWFTDSDDGADQLRMLSYSVALNGTLTMLNYTNAYTPAGVDASVYEAWRLLENTGYSPVDPNGHNGNGVVPEPSTLLLLGAGLAGVARAARRRH